MIFIQAQIGKVQIITKLKFISGFMEGGNILEHNFNRNSFSYIYIIWDIGEIVSENINKLSNSLQKLGQSEILELVEPENLLMV